MTGETCRHAGAMAGRVCVVTGANRGIGRATARGLADRGATVVLVCRDGARGRAARDEIRRRTGNASVELAVADLASAESIRALADELEERFPALHVLVNNAAIVSGERTVTDEGLELTFAVNHLAVFRLVERLRDRLVESVPARIVTVSSEAHRGAELDLDDLQMVRAFAPLRAYARSKLANILHTRELARRLEGTGVTANCLHPGVIRTGLASDYMRNMAWWVRLGRPLIAPFLTSPDAGASTPVWAASEPSLAGATGRYFVDRADAEPSAAARDAELAAALWRRSQELA